jgi:hypothetical protein
MRSYSRVLTALLFTTLAAHAGEKTVMHCFAWTPIKEATPAEWEAFYKASDALPQKINGLTKIWYSKLPAPFGVYSLSKLDADTTKKLRAGEPVTAEVTRTPREYGMCMQFTTAEAFKAYDTDPYHKIWTDAYAKIRVDGTTTFNIMGQ